MGLTDVFDRGRAFELEVYGMACDRCRQAVEAGIEGLDAVRSVSVEIEANRARVRAIEDVDADRIVEAIRAVGYEARPVPGGDP